MAFYYIRPEVAGSVGPRSVEDRSVHPPIVTRLHYEFDGWLGGAILESFPCYIVTDPLKKALEDEGFTGCEFDEVEISASEQFADLYPERVEALPKFHWLKLTGKAGNDDLGMSSDHVLVVSERVLETLKNYEMSDCDVDPYKA